MLPSIREEIKDEMLASLSEESSRAMELDIPTEDPQPVRKTFDPNTAAGRVDQVIAERIRPGVNSDGGDVELVELTPEGVAIVKLVGACNGCPSSGATLKHAIEKTLLHFCAGEVTAVEQAVDETPTIDSGDLLEGMASFDSALDLPTVISHNHVGRELDTPLSQQGVPVVSLFARQVDEKMVSRVKFASTVTVPKDSKSGIDVWVKCVDCGAQKRLEDVSDLLRDAKTRNPTTDRVAVVVCPACAVMIVEK